MKHEKTPAHAAHSNAVGEVEQAKKRSSLPAGSFTAFLNRNTLRLLVLFSVTFIAYIPAMGGAYIWDDDHYVTHNHTLETPAGLGRIWLEPKASPQYYPLVFSSFWLERRLWGLNPTGYHVVNVLLHVSVAGLLFYILEYLEIPGAWLAAMIFALHPVHVETTAWISERKNLLSGLFYMCSAIFFLRFFRVRDPAENSYGKAQPLYYFAGLVFFVWALLSKTVTCTLPAVLMLVLWWKRGRITPGEGLLLVPPFIVGGVMGLLTAWLERSHVGAKGAEWGLSIIERFLVAGRIVCFYIWKLLYPAELIFNYPHWNIDGRIWWQYLYPLAVAGLILLLWAKRERLGRGPLVALLFFGITLFPALGFVNVFPFRFSYVADHFQYLASIGIIALIAAIASAAISRYSPPKNRMLIGATAVMLVLLAGRTWVQGYAYADEWTLWNDTLRKNPESSIAHNNIGDALLRRGNRREAMDHFTEALRIMPSNEEAHYNMGVVLALMGKTDEAMEHYREALRLDPNFPAAMYNLGTLFLNKGSYGEAIRYLSQAVNSKPDFIMARHNLMHAYEGIQDQESAMEQYKKIKELDPNYEERSGHQSQAHND